MTDASDPAAVPLSYLFRYRDLVADTLTEHRTIIKSAGACWWGWWKRPTEDSRMEIWNDLKARATKDAPVTVGLFNSGTGRMRLAKVIEVILPTQGGGHPIVPAGESALIPSYYRKSPFSVAWMKFSEISSTDAPLFGSYSFAAAPSLPSYPPVVLDRFNGKVIKDADELRGMDTTIWLIRLTQPYDNDKNIILTVPGPAGPISYDAVSAKGRSILHLTDLHYALGGKRQQHIWGLGSDGDTTMIDAVTLALKHENIGLVVVTGDLTFLGSAAEFDAAAKALFSLLGVLQLGPDHLIVVPGNHDIVWSSDVEYSDGADVKVAPLTATENYRNFYKTMFRHDANQHLSMGRRYVFPSGLVVEIAALNSSSLETGKNFLAGMGRIQETAFQHVANELKWHDDKSLALRALALHHHLTLTENLEPAEGFYHGFGIAVDAPRIQRMAARHGVQLALHGHKHRCFVWQSTVYELLEEAHPKHQLGNLSIVGGGSAGSSETDGKRNFFNILDVDADALKLRVFKSTNRGSFDLMTTYEAGLSYDSKTARFCLDPWTKK
jgi:predicted phosphodiesterase